MLKVVENPLISQGLEDFLRYLRETEQNYNMAVADEKQTNDETQDILHAIEFGKGNWTPKQLLRKLGQVRKKRRIVKDTIAASVLIVEWYQSNKNVISELERLLGDVRKIEKKRQNRAYAPRSRNGRTPRGIRAGQRSGVKWAAGFCLRSSSGSAARYFKPHGKTGMTRRNKICVGWFALKRTSGSDTAIRKRRMRLFPVCCIR